VQTVNAVLESDPPELAPEVVPGIRRIVGRLLEKTPDARFQSARDLAFALSALSDGTTSTTGRVARGGKGTLTWKTVSAIALIAAALSAALTAAVSWRPRDAAPSAPPSLKRFAIDTPSPVRPAGIALAPDGTRLVYRAGAGSDSLLFQRRLDALEATPIDGTETAYAPFFSPDGNWIGFASTRDRKLKKVPVNGGPPVSIADATEVMQGTWGTDGTIVVALRTGSLMAVSAEGGTLRPLTTPDKNNGVIDHHAPSALPGGALLFDIHAGPEIFRVAVRLPNGDERALIDDAYFARYVPSGHIVFGRPDGLYAARFDLDRLQIEGPSVLVVEQVLTDAISGTMEFAIADDGTLAYVPARPLGGRQLVWVDRKGQAAPLPTPPGAYQYPALSPDGQRLAIEISDGARHDISVYDFRAAQLTRITLEGSNTKPIWSPDGQRVVYAARRPEGYHIMWQPLNARAAASSLVVSPNPVWPGTWTRDGERLTYVEDPPTSLDNIRMLRIGASVPPELLLGAPPAYLHPQVSPDGQWLAYVAWESRPQVFIRPLAGGATRQITPDGGGQPRWSRDGTELFYRRLGAMMRVPIRTTPELQIGRAEKLFDEDFVSSGFGPPDYDVTADGQRFLFVKRAEAERTRVPIHVVVNWFDELRKRVPAGQ
jgi:serine/threonine-protein kinase